MATIFEDNFNSYNDGDLNGQGSWAGNVAFDVEGTVYIEDGGTPAYKAVQVITTSTGGNRVIYKAGTALMAGRVSFYWRRTINNNGGAYLMVNEGGTGQWKVFVAMENTGQIVHYYNGGSDNVAAYIANTWYLVEIEWASDGTARVRVDEGTWSNWRDAYGNWTTGLNGIDLIAGNTTLSRTTYYDYIAENPYMPPLPRRRATFIKFF